MPTTPNMNMQLPTVQVTTDPTWATQLNSALTNAVDTHDHTSGKGVQVPTAGLNINADLSFNSNDAIDLRSLALNNNVATLSNANVRCVYASGGDLYYNNNSGVAIQLTTGSSLNTGALALNVWSHQSVSGNLIIPANASYIYLSVDTTSSRTITLPAANGVTAGRFFIIKDATGNSATNNITVTPAGSDTLDTSASSYTLNYTFGSLMCVSDGVSNWQLFKEGSPGATASTLGTIKLAGDLAGSGSTFNTPRVVDATSSVKGKLQLAGDLAGDSSSSSAPTISALTGVSGVITGPSKHMTMGTNPATDGYGLRLAYPAGSGKKSGVFVRNSGNSANITAVGVDTNNVVNIGDSNVFHKFSGGQREQINLVDTTTYTVDVNGNNIKDNIIYCNTSVGAITITLPSSELDGRVLVIKDIAGQADGYNITITTPASETIDGYASWLIREPYGSITLGSDEDGNWYVLNSYDGYVNTGYSYYEDAYVQQRIPIGLDPNTVSGDWLINAGIQSMTNFTNLQSKRDVYILNPPDGATLYSVTMRYNPGGSSRTPATRLGINIERIASDEAMTGGTGDSLISGVSVSGGITAQVPAYSFPAAYTTYEFVCDQNNVIDNKLYQYVIRVESESGAGASAPANSVSGFVFHYKTLVTI